MKLYRAFLSAAVPAIVATLPAHSDTKIEIVSSAELKSEQARLFADFSTSLLDYYGAFYIDLNSDTALGLSNFHDLENGMKFTRRMCEVTLEQPQNTCALYAVFLPDQTTSINWHARSMSQTASEVFATNYLDGETQNTFASFAISPLYNFAYSLDQETQDIADANALAECAEGVSEYLYNLYPKILELVESEDLVECRIIDRSMNNKP